jgi:hypothetical protein
MLLLMNRYQRGINQPIYLINMENIIKDDERIFNVLGTTKKKYVITIGNKLKCTCLDCTIRGKICKHIHFVLFRICKCTNIENNTVEKRKLMFANIPLFIDSNLLVATEIKIEKIIQRMDDCCPICLDDLKNENVNLLNFCQFGCGKSYHKKCFEICSKLKITENCAFCRQKLK